MKAKEAQKFRNILLAAGFITMLAGYLWDPFSIIGLAVAFSCLIPHSLYNKCPHCGKQPGRNEGDFCQHCGGKID